ncbi:MAG: ribbon-helix-helix protein, CopG family [Acidimicrobiia bacterium]|jgi:predicted DNA binding CopG/RHH family protein|nr:ribbon-helix-helix protein, CopG family [Acidimicrobiia bacterium]
MTDKTRESVREERMLEQSRIEELARYFDRSDVSDPDTWEEVDDAIVERPELEQISLRLPKDDLAEIKRRANRTGVGYTTLIRMILREHLQNPLVR